jgi:hypothetical protein
MMIDDKKKDEKLEQRFLQVFCSIGNPIPM